MCGEQEARLDQEGLGVADQSPAHRSTLTFAPPQQRQLLLRLFPTIDTMGCHIWLYVLICNYCSGMKCRMDIGPWPYIPSTLS